MGIRATLEEIRAEIQQIRQNQTGISDVVAQLTSANASLTQALTLLQSIDGNVFGIGSNVAQIYLQVLGILENTGVVANTYQIDVNAVQALLRQINAQQQQCCLDLPIPNVPILPPDQPYLDPADELLCRRMKGLMRDIVDAWERVVYLASTYSSVSASLIATVVAQQVPPLSALFAFIAAQQVAAKLYDAIANSAIDNIIPSQTVINSAVSAAFASREFGADAATDAAVAAIEAGMSPYHVPFTYFFGAFGGMRPAFGDAVIDIDGIVADCAPGNSEYGHTGYHIPAQHLDGGYYTYYVWDRYGYQIVGSGTFVSPGGVYMVPASATGSPVRIRNNSGSTLQVIIWRESDAARLDYVLPSSDEGLYTLTGYDGVIVRSAGIDPAPLGTIELIGST